MKHFIFLALLTLISSCGGSGSKLDCSYGLLPDLDATWKVHVDKNTLVTWPDSGKTERRKSEFTGLIIGDQCRDHLKFFGMGGFVDEYGAQLYLDETTVDFYGLKYTVTGEGYIDGEFAWAKTKTEYSFVTYDTDWTFILLERKFD